MAQLPPTRTAAAHHRPATHPTQDEPNHLQPPASSTKPNECTDDTGRNRVVVSDVYGARSVVDISQLAKDFKPTLIITLIDDVYSAWWRTEARAKANSVIGGNPSFEQLVMARRSEMMLGDMLALQSDVEPMCRHVVLAVHHPTDTLWNLVANDAHAIYLSFPISQPRRLLGEGDLEGQQAINAYHHEILRRQIDNPTLAFISPLAIDELPFAEVLKRGRQPPGGTITFDWQDRVFAVASRREAERWSPSELWGDSTVLLSGPAPEPIPIDLPASDSTDSKPSYEDVVGLLKTDVSWRDYRLVSQSAALAVFCPVMKGSTDLSSGVRMEVEQATTHHIPSFVYQNSEWDPHGLVEKALQADAGAMAVNPQARFQHLFVGPGGLSQMLDTLCRDIGRGMREGTA